ncbi:hypothetical protein [Citrobacter freundii]|uniref:hypothetical protein n=1 Tax=Citrobacter freundii TaxID=546 RepID=UPI000B491E69|nr:hypothetical protein [Citrobacter freundii]EGV7505274.1 hypothetical protein [Salmonella enterica]MBJ9331825.1 hypothetical protein [Citrobacter freundii]RDT34341.1 hypothetical protein DXF86_24360 [Citrobacter freundii]HAT2303306.1 hypothetical protein [Citrobacter freundii]HCJ7682991.1 hypothetical protein [Citrobacter freundii]
MQGEVDEQQPNEIMSEFGYYPVEVNIETEQFSLLTLPGLAEKVERVNNDKNVVKGWIYPGNQEVYNLNGGITTMPYSHRVFGMPKTHTLKLKNTSSLETLNFAVWCLSFFKGIRLTTTDAGFLDATTIKPAKLTDFTLSRCSEKAIIELALNYISSEQKTEDSPIKIAAVVHALFLSHNPQYLSFEKFQYLYMALDGCFALAWAEKNKCSEKTLNHSRRLKWLCETYGIPRPSWVKGKKNITTIRNDNFHEAIFLGQPLGFSSVNNSQYGNDILLQMQALVCRLLVAILSVNDCSYLKSSVNSRDYDSLKIN